MALWGIKESHTHERPTVLIIWIKQIECPNEDHQKPVSRDWFIYDSFFFQYRDEGSCDIYDILRIEHSQHNPYLLKNFLLPGMHNYGWS